MRQYTWPATWVAKNGSLSHTESKEVREVEVRENKNRVKNERWLVFV